MNIREAKEELKNIVRAYLAKDENGMPRIPVEHQRPVLLMGPPGIGKTAVMEQIAKELKINLVSYTITHHTRQSAIGLPGIVHRSFGGEEHAVTEYTMSEIIAAVYEQIELSGVREGILFLDEINCVSETLAPTMLQFLQYKTFGTHKVPDSFIIVTAGNPPEYNQSVREFDIVTLDRLRRIDIDADLQAFKEYAYRSKLHGAILAYLEIHKDRFYRIHADTDRKSFVTARGWEDLSDAIKAYEALKLPVGEALMGQYLQDPEISEDFAIYYELYRKYESFFRIPEILSGKASPDSTLRNAPFDEKLSFISLLTDSLGTEFKAYRDDKAAAEKCLSLLKETGRRLKELLAQPSDRGAVRTSKVLGDIISFHSDRREQLKRSGMLSYEEERDGIRTEKILKELNNALREHEEEQGADPRMSFAYAKKWFAEREEERQQAIALTGEHLTNVFRALNETFPQGQEMVIFLSELNSGYYSLKFVNECGNEDYYHYNRLLLLKERGDSLRQEILRLTEEI